MKNETYTYLAEIHVAYEECKERTDNIIVYAPSFQGAMEQVFNYYNDEDITDIKLTWVSDMPFALAPDQIENIVAKQEKIYWGD